MPFTDHVTFVVGPLVSDAMNCCDDPAISPMFAGVTVRPSLTTVNVDHVAEPSGAVTVIGPVVLPSGTDVTMRFVLASLTVAEVPLKATVG
jgi:hypothetical protein